MSRSSSKRRIPSSKEGEYGQMVSDPAASARNQQSNTTGPVWTIQGQEQEWRAIGLVMMPEEFATLLYADSYTSEKMCKRGILQSVQATWMVAAAQDLRWLKPDEWFGSSHRGNGALWRRAHIYKTNPNGDALLFRLKHSQTRSLTSPAVSDYLKLQQDNNTFNFNLADCDPSAGGSALAKDWNSSTMVCGRSQSDFPNARWFLLNAVPAATNAAKRSKITLTYNPALALPGNCEITLVGWRGGSCDNLAQVTIPAAAAPVPPVSFTLTGATLGRPDFYTLTYSYAPNVAGGQPAEDTNFDAAGAGFAIDGASYCAGLTQTPTDSAYPNIMQLGLQTTIAASMRLTNMAPPLQIQGESVVCQTRGRETWMNWYLAGGGGAGSPLDIAASYRDRFLGKLMNGGYAWHMPFKKDQFELEECCDLDYERSIIKDVWWDIEDTSDVNVFTARSQNNGLNDGQTGMGCDCWLTIVTHFNWTTDNKWPDADLAPYSYTVWASALDNLRFVPKCMSNKYHMAELLGWLNKNGRPFVRKYVAPLLYHGGREAAKRFLGVKEEEFDRGVGLLKDAYNLGDEIVSRLKGGGM